MKINLKTSDFIFILDYMPRKNKAVCSAAFLLYNKKIESFNDMLFVNF